MRNLAYLAMVILISTVLLTAGCAPPTKTPVPPEVGTIKDVDAGKGTITITTEAGATQTVQITPDTQLLLEGKACTLAELDALLQTEPNLLCSVIVEEGKATTVNVFHDEFNTTSSQIQNIDLAKQTITVKNGQVVVVLPDTQLLLDGKACTLNELDARLKTEPNLACSLIADEEQPDQALVISASPE